MLNLTTEQKAKVTVKPITASGKPAVVDGVPGWSINNLAVAALVIAPDGMSADVIAAGIGSAIVTVSADADLTTAVREILGTLNVNVVAAEASSLLLEAGIPTTI